MRPIQFILALLLLVVMLTYFRKLRSHLLDRLIVIVLGSAGLAMAIMPEWSNTVAHFFGVGRGVDLVIYLSITGLAFLWIMLYATMRQQHEQMTELVRALALAQARPPDDCDPAPPAQEDATAATQEAAPPARPH
jgi:hypothetical protein